MYKNFISRLNAGWSGCLRGTVRLRSWSLLSVLLSSLLLLHAGVASAAPKAPPVKITRRIYTDNINQLTVDVEITLATKPTGGTVKIKYIYNGLIPIQESYANWSMSYLNENDQLVIKQLSVPLGGSELQGSLGTKAESQASVLDAPFPCLQLVNPCYDITVGARPVTGETVSAAAIAPDSISGPVALQPGQSATLRVMGGSLPRGSSWVWYEGSCGGSRVATGRSFTVTPRGSSSYFVRAEPGDAPCLSISIRGDNRSVAPQGISGSGMQCQGEPLALQVLGGALGVGAEWVWYTGACGTTKVGTGRTYTVPAPARTGASTTYFVRAEGEYNTTDCARQTVEVTTGRSESPSRISTSGSLPYCEGTTQPMYLKVEGGRLAKGSHWAWYANACSGQPIGQGESLPITPGTTTTYLVRAEGACLATNPVSLLVRVVTKSVGPASISGPSQVASSTAFELRVNGGQLGEGAQWKWYADGCNSGKLLGTGPTLSLKLRKTTQIYVKAVGPCGESACATTSVATNPVAARSWQHGFQPRNFVHFGIGFGLDYQHASLLTGRQTTLRPSGIVRNDSVRSDADGFGLIGELTFHPLIKNGFSLGIQSSAALGTGVYRLLSETNTNGRKRFSYYEFRAGGEMALGARRLKLLLTQEHRVREYRFENQDTDLVINQHATNYAVKVGVGTRIGAYGRGNKTANNVDFLAYLSRGTTALTSSPVYASIPRWNVGAGFNWWCHNKVGIRLEAIFKDQEKDYSVLNTSLSGAQFNATLTLKEDFFR